MKTSSKLQQEYPERFCAPFLKTDYCAVKGIRTRFAKAGSGDVVVCLHGFPENLQTWRYYMQLLSPYYTVLAPDLKGFGYSDKPPGDYSPEGMADFVGAFLDVLKVESAYCIGSDIGFTIASAFALKYAHRVKKLVLMAGTVYEKGICSPEITIMGMPYLGEIIFYLFGKMAIHMGLKKGFYSKDFVSRELFEEYYLPYSSKDAQRRALDLIRAFNKRVPGLQQEIKNIAVPSLVLWGEKERYFSPEILEWLKRDIHSVRIEVIPECGHFIQEEKPQESAAVIRSFFT